MAARGGKMRVTLLLVVEGLYVRIATDTGYVILPITVSESELLESLGVSWE